MNERVFRCSPILIVLLVCIGAAALVSPAPAAADEGPRLSLPARAAFAAVAPAQAASCGVCAAAYQRCFGACLGSEDKAGLGECLTACDNAAATCTCDEVVGLRSEDLVDFEWPSESKAACHGNVSCQPYYPSCASWSSYSNCGTPYCGIGARCGDCEWIEGKLFCEPGPAWKRYQERFRVCFDAQGHSCTEWQQTVLSSCGC